MAVVQCMAACIICRRVFLFNPLRVPSVRVEGEREPVCLDCMTRANAERAARGRDPLVILPGAYDPLDEAEWIHDD